ncbi:MAG: LamG domain-containing protein [Streptosporangiaceae bacterium]|jgi:hypothetical protein
MKPLRALFGATTVALGAAMVTMPALTAPAATAATSAPRAAVVSRDVSRAAGQPDGGVNSSASSSWQTDNIVWALAYAKGVVYVGGQFTSVRPPGDPAGTGTVARTYLAAFSSTTGALIKSFDPKITSTSSSPGVYALAVSPDGKTLYAGGTFNHVNGSPRGNLAAFSTAKGALTSWRPTAGSKVNRIAVSRSGSSIYLGGLFASVDGVARTYAGAVNAAGNLLRWAPVLDGPLYTLAVPPNGSQVLLGGYFQTINGVTQNAAGAVDPTTGRVNVRWGANIVPWHPGTCTSTVKDIVVSGSTAYLAAEGNGGGCFDGDFAVRLGATDKATDSLAWQNDCLGATQALEVVNGWLFKGSHAHDCAYAPGGFPQVDQGSGWVTWHLLDQSLASGTLGHWTPDTNVGTTELGVGDLGPHAMATDGSQLFVGGDFTKVNGKRQQGFARFGRGPDQARPSTPAAPAVTSTARGVDSVTFTAVSTPDVGTLSYQIYRDTRKTPVGTVTATSWPWALPVLHYRDAGLRPGSRHTYRVRVSNGTHYSLMSRPSALVKVSATNPPRSYARTVLRDKPFLFWLLDQTSGKVAADSSSHHFNGRYEPGTRLRVSGPIAGSRVTATSFNGRYGLVTAAKPVASPRAFSIEGWFKTTTNTGGMLVGFGNHQTGASTRYDRHVYMMNDGQLAFGVYNPALKDPIQAIESPNVYNNGQWHYVVATFGPRAGSGQLALYVDGRRVAAMTTSSDQSYVGYWRVGGDNLGGWNLDPWGSNSQGTTEPHSYYFGGSIGAVAVYRYALSAAQVAAHYAANALSH